MPPKDLRKVRAQLQKDREVNLPTAEAEEEREQILAASIGVVLVPLRNQYTTTPADSDGNP